VSSRFQYMTVLHCTSALLPTGWSDDVRVEIGGGLITRVDVGMQAQANDERHAIAVPGIASLHSHAFQRGMAGLAETRGGMADTFWTWRDAMYRFALALSPDDMQAVATQLYVEMLERGFTRVGEFHYLHHTPDGAPYDNPAEMVDRIAQAAHATGIGLTLLPSFYAYNGFGGVAPHAGQRRFICNIDQFGRLVSAVRATLRDLPGANLGIAPHSLRAVTPEQLTALASLIDDGPLHIHVAEQMKEVDDCLAWSGQRPVQWLLEHANVDARWCLIHATHMTSSEITALAASGAVAGLCPITEASLGDGIFSAREFLAANGRFGIGTDSNVLVGLTDELRQLEYSQRLKHQERNVLARDLERSTGRALFDGALHGGSQALGQPVAGLTVGASADIVTLDPTHPSLAGRNGDVLLDGWIFATRNEAIDCVWARGVKVVADGRHKLRQSARGAFNSAVRRLVA
jgi:formimidoylglutamate deiminase